MEIELISFNTSLLKETRYNEEIPRIIQTTLLQIGPGQQHSQQHKFTLGPQELEATDTYKYLGITINTKGDLSDHLKIIKGKTQASTHTIINLASSNPLRESKWKQSGNSIEHAMYQ